MELASQLQLSDDQNRRVRELFDTMTSEAVPIGETLIQQEAVLDRAFADQQISPVSLSQLTTAIGETQGRLRAVHLKYHLITTRLLTTQQKQRYVELRGYR